MIAMVPDGVCALQTTVRKCRRVSGQRLQVGDFCLSEVAGDVCNFIHARPAIRDTHYFSLYGHGRKDALVKPSHLLWLWLFTNG